MVLFKLRFIFLGLGACKEINPKAGAMVLAGSRHGPAQICDLSMMNNTQESTFVFNRQGFRTDHWTRYSLTTLRRHSHGHSIFSCERLQRSQRHMRNVLPLVCASEQPTMWYGPIGPYLLTNIPRLLIWRGGASVQFTRVYVGYAGKRSSTLGDLPLSS